MKFAKSLLRFAKVFVAFYLILVAGYELWASNQRTNHRIDEDKIIGSIPPRPLPHYPVWDSEAKDTALRVEPLAALGLTILWLEAVEKRKQS